MQQNSRGRFLGIEGKWWLIGGCLVGAAGLAALCLTVSLILGVFVVRQGTSQSAWPTPTVPAPTRLTGNPVSQMAPDFTLLDLDGNPITLSDLRGRPVLINFWATWCGPCRTEMPVIQAAYERYREQGLVVLAVDVQEGPTFVERYVRQAGFTFTILYDRDGSVSDRYLVRGLPTSFFVDRQGLIRAQYIGAMDEAVLARQLSLILECKNPDCPDTRIRGADPMIRPSE